MNMVATLNGKLTARNHPAAARATSDTATTGIGDGADANDFAGLVANAGTNSGAGQPGAAAAGSVTTTATATASEAAQPAILQPDVPPTLDDAQAPATSLIARLLTGGKGANDTAPTDIVGEQGAATPQATLATGKVGRSAKRTTGADDAAAASPVLSEAASGNGKPSTRKAKAGEEAATDRVETATTTTTASPATVAPEATVAAALVAPLATGVQTQATPTIRPRKAEKGDTGRIADSLSSSASPQATQRTAAPEKQDSKAFEASIESATSQQDTPVDGPAIDTALARSFQQPADTIVLAGAAAHKAGPQIDVGATLSGQVIDMAVGGQWIDRMAQEIAALAGGSGHSRFQLSPPNLGRMQVDLWQGPEGSKVQILTETDEAARRLNDGKAGLEADARLSALSLGPVIIERAAGGSLDSGADGSAQNMSQQSFQQQPSQQQPSQGGQSATPTNGQTSSQTGTQTGGQTGGQQNTNKEPPRQDVLNERTDRVQSESRRDGATDDDHVRYA